jgi:ABC-type microcin C transport system permease subunit YejE
MSPWPTWLVRFRHDRRGIGAATILALLLIATGPAEFIANDRPLVVSYVGYLFFPILRDYPETAFGGDFETHADYSDGYLRFHIDRFGWMRWPIVPFSYDTPIADLPQQAPTPPSDRNWLGTDAWQRDVLAELIYGLRLSLLTGLGATVVCVGAVVAAKRASGLILMLPAIAVAALAALDAAGLGVSERTPSLGRLIGEGLSKPHAPWEWLSGAFGLALLVAALVLLGRALRDSMAPQPRS